MKSKIIGTAISYLVCLVILFLFSSKISENLFRFISLAGVLASLFGLGIIWIQSATIKSATDASKDAVEKTKDRLNAFTSIVDLTKMIKTIQEIQNYNRLKKYELSIMRMQELREGLQRVNHSPKFESHIDPKGIKSNISTLSIDMASIEKEFLKSGSTIDTSILNENLDKILKTLSELNSRIRYSGA